MTGTDVIAVELDHLLKQLGGSWSRFQLKFNLCICVAIILSAMYQLSYVFTSRNALYRCVIPECDGPEPKYDVPYIANAIPLTETGEPKRCVRYEPVYPNETVTSDHQCAASLFEKNSIETCNDLVYSMEDRTILNDFNLTCPENLWKLTFVGTANSIGQFICMPLSGYVADRYGRRITMIGSLIGSTIAGLIRSFSTSYPFFLSFEFLDAVVGAGAYNAAFILALEMTGPEERVLTSSIICSFFAIGEAILGIAAWLEMSSWRGFLRLMYLPGFMSIIFFWFTPESVRWELSKGRLEKAKDTLRKAANTNSIALSEQSLATLGSVSTLNDVENCSAENCKDKKEENIWKTLIKSRVLLARIVNCSMCWATCNFVFYGLSQNSVAISGNLHLNFILVSLIEIPGYVISYALLDKLGRRLSQCGSFLLTGVACLGFIFVPATATWTRLALYLLGKLAITTAFTVLYIFTSEIFPTPLRQSLLSFCSMIGRLGLMVAPQMPLLSLIFEALPLYLFGGLCIFCGLLSILLPETLHTRLPDTIKEAENIGKKVEPIK